MGDSLVGHAVTFAYAVLAAVMVGGGVIAEFRSVAALQSGRLVYGLWLVAVGVVAIAAGTMLFTGKVRDRMHGA